MNKQLKVIIDTLCAVHKNNSCPFPVPVVVRMSDKDFDLFEVHAVCVSQKKELMIQNSKSVWSKLDETTEGAEKKISAILDRVQKVYKPNDILI